MINFGNKLNTQYQNIWVTSDLHFDHGNILKFCPDTRKYGSIQGMNVSLIQEWNSKVMPEDIIIHLGDFCFKGVEVTESFLSQLNGRKIMVLGNHDKALRNNVAVGKHGIEFIGDYLELQINKQKVVFSHYPMTTWNQCGRGAIQLFGHCHGSLPEPKGRQMDVGYDALGEIKTIDEVMKICNNKPIFTPDHH